MNPKSLSDSFQKLLLVSFHLLIFFTPLLWTSFTSELFELPKMHYVYFMTALITGLWLMRMVVHKKLIFTRTFLDIPITLFLISQILATIFSLNIHTSLYGYYSRFHGGLFSTISYILLYYAFVSNISRDQIKNILITLLTTSTLAALYAFPEHFGHSPSCAYITGQFNASCWKQAVQLRVFGTFGQPNWLAAYLITVIFIPIAILLRSLNLTKPKLTLQNAALWAMTLLFFLTLIFTKSRSGMLGLAIGCVIFILSILISQKSHLKSSLKWGSLILASLGLSFFIFGKGAIPQLNPLLPPYQSSIDNRTSTIESQTGTVLATGGTESGEIRRIVWQGAWDLFRTYPVFGSGTETFAYGYYQVRPIEHNHVSEWDFLYNKAHNEFLNLLSTTGILGLATYLIFYLSITFYLIRSIKNHQHPYLSSAILAGLWALAVSNFFGFSTVPVGLLLFLLPAIAITLNQNKQFNNVAIKQLALTQYLALIIILFITLLSITKVYNHFQADISYNLGKNALAQSDVVTAIAQFDDALNRFPSEPNYTEQLALATAQAALLTNQTQDATAAGELAVQAQALANLNVQQNPAHLNYHKSRARVYITLAQIDPQFVNLAIQALEIGQIIAPTDPKLVYNIGLLTHQTGDANAAIDHYLAAIALKPDYFQVRKTLADLYTELGENNKAIDQYQYLLDHHDPNNKAIQKIVESLESGVGSQ